MTKGSEPKLGAIKHLKPKDLVPYAKNSRTHSVVQIDQIVASINEFGFTNPILTDGKGSVIAGHGRLLAALKLGLETVPTISLEHLTAAQRRAYIIADNKLALNAGWNIDKPMKSETGHSTQKPVECMKRPIENNSSPGQAVYEPFSGSGTTIIAAEMTGRACYAIELSPTYVDVAVKRWEDFTGEKAVRADNLHLAA